MSARLFALVIGIDHYKSGSIWNLESAVSDAKSIKHWLVHHLGVPRHQVRTLLDNEATTSNVEAVFASHLLDNPAIERGDAIFIYWAGHGSSMSAHKPMSASSSARRYSKTDILVTYDHETKNPSGFGRISGISDRSMYSMICALSAAKGDNITLALDASFSTLTQSRGSVRWTPTIKATAADVMGGLWRASDPSAGERFFQNEYDTHNLLAASGPGERAVEGNDGGQFTQSLIKAAGSLPLHRTSYAGLISHIISSNSSFNENHNQTPRSLGRHKSRIIFNELPFIADERYIALDGHSKSNHFRIKMGSVDGILEGMELSMHGHNRRGSLNPALDSLRVLEVHPTWSLAKQKSRDGAYGEWAQITQKTSFNLRRHLPFAAAGRAIKVYS